MRPHYYNRCSLTLRTQQFFSYRARNPNLCEIFSSLRVLTMAYHQRIYSGLPSMPCQSHHTSQWSSRPHYLTFAHGWLWPTDHHLHHQHHPHHSACRNRIITILEILGTGASKEEDWSCGAWSRAHATLANGVSKDYQKHWQHSLIVVTD